MKPTRVYFCVTNDLTYDRRMNRICQTLTNEGFQCELIGREITTSEILVKKSFNQTRLHCFINKGPLFYLEMNLRLVLYLLKQPFDILCACDLDTVPAVWFVSRFRKVKTVYDAHEYFTEVPELTNRPIKKGVWSLVAKIMIPTFDVSYTVGEELAKIMGKKYDVPFQVVRNIATQSKQPQTIPSFHDREQLIVYQGAINIGRGLPELILAMKQLPDWKLKIAGKGDIDNELSDLIKKESLGNRVELLGWVKPEEIPDLMSKAKVTVNLREKGSLNDYYSLPNKFFDTLQSGVPSINMRYPEYENVIKTFPGSILIDSVDPDIIAKAIKEIVTSEETWNKMSNASLRAASRYSWENDSEVLVTVYKKLGNKTS